MNNALKTYPSDTVVFEYLQNLLPNLGTVLTAEQIEDLTLRLKMISYVFNAVIVIKPVINQGIFEKYQFVWNQRVPFSTEQLSVEIGPKDFSREILSQKLDQMTRQYQNEMDDFTKEVARDPEFLINKGVPEEVATEIRKFAKEEVELIAQEEMQKLLEDNNV